MASIIIFASGAGSNAAAVIAYLAGSGSGISVSQIITNNAAAGVLDVAEKNCVPARIIAPADLSSEAFVQELSAAAPALIVLAGFLKKIPPALVAAFPQKIINLHPALLPLHGGAGMYGARVHEAALASGAPESGITIHYVNEAYDEGGIILQARCPVLPADTPAALAARIHTLEHFYLPRTIEFLLGQSRNTTAF